MGKRAVRNTAIVLAARVASRAIALVTIIAVGHYLGPDGFGQQQTVITYVALTNVTLDLGYGTLYVREGARHRDQLSAYLGTLMSLKLISSVLGAVCLVGFLALAGVQTLLLSAIALMVTAAFSNLLRSSLYAVQRLGYEAFAIVAESALQLGLALWGIANHYDISFFIWSYVITYTLTIAFFAIVLQTQRMLKVGFAWDYALLRRWFVTSLAVGFTSVVTTVYFKVDVPILQQFRSYTEVGWYTLAYKPFEALLFLPFTLRNIVFPVLSVYYSNQSERLPMAAEKLYRGLLLLAWPTALGLFILIGPINDLMHLYPQSAPSLQILALGIPFVFVDNTFIATLLAMNRQALFFKIALAGFAFNLILDFTLIPSHGYLGASWATSITEALLCVLGWWVLRHEGMTLNVVKLSWKILLAGLIMAAAMLPFTAVRGAASVAVIAGGGLVYGVALLVLRTADPDEWSLVRRALGRAG